MKEKHVNEGVEIVIVPSALRAAYGSRDTGKVEKAVRAHLLQSKEPYHKVQVHVKHAADGAPVALHAYMLRAYTYTADIVKMVIDAKYNVRSVDASYGGEEEGDYGDVVAPMATIPAGAIAPAVGAVAVGTIIGTVALRVDMVFGTPVPEIPTAKAAVEAAYRTAVAAGYKAVKLLGPAANLANYKKYLGGHLKAFGNVGHGYTGGIVLADGNLTSAWFAALPKKTLSPEVIYFNSCQVFNPPLQPAIMLAGARTFAGGKVNLLIGPSEKVFNCFWDKVLKKPAVKMGVALTTCEKANYPTVGAHGIGGDLGLF